MRRHLGVRTVVLLRRAAVGIVDGLRCLAVGGILELISMLEGMAWGRGPVVSSAAIHWITVVVVV
jgi:hypothetical protein